LIVAIGLFSLLILLDYFIRPIVLFDCGHLRRRRRGVLMSVEVSIAQLLLVDYETAVVLAGA